MDTGLAILTYLLVKHMLADFVLQGRYQYANKGRYGHPGGLLHAAIHVALTMPLLLALRPNAPELYASVGAFELVVHYHIDYLKESWTRGKHLTPEKAAYWHALGLDQLAHQLTYVAIAAYLLG